ncbi:hypothetical protein GN244_ATG19429 [Phytophthora infestans]|uniref:RxLR effector PexRD54 WY domain-containing protein n=1 Tax=Phytophthora infestans TaxID=4787 RepID=A0A833S4N0_PHYIN|nr:hypothetical protein GN244_ATG19429 [Phytophthora infestans]
MIVKAKVDRNKGKTVDDALKLLRLNPDQGYEMLKNPNFKSWFLYVKKTGQNFVEVLYHKLKTRFSDEEILKMFFAAKRDDQTAVYMSGMDGVLKDHWFGQKKTAGDIFTHLSLHEDGTETLKSMVDQALRSTIPKTLKGPALRLEQTMWLLKGRTPQEAFNHLKLYRKGDDLFFNPTFPKWVSYVNSLNKNENEYAVISELAKRFGGDVNLARALHEAKIRTGDSADTIVSLQNLQFNQWRWKNNWVPEQLKNDPNHLAINADYKKFYEATRKKVPIMESRLRFCRNYGLDSG